MGFRSVRPEQVVLTLSAGKTITVKRRLTTFEERQRLKRSRDGGIDYLDYGFYTVVAYLLDWSASDGVVPAVIQGVDDATLIDTLNAMDPDDFIEVKQAIELHIGAMIQERTEEKKTILTSGNGSRPISDLPSIPDGLSNASAISIPMSATN